MSTPTDLDKLVIKILSDLENRNGIVGIDGIDGIGKTPIAKLLGGKLQIPTILLDDYLMKNRDSYVDALRRDLAGEIAELNGVGIVEGVCLLAVAERFDFRINTHIYLKRTHLQIWADEDIFDTGADPSEVISQKEDEIFGMEPWFAAQENSPPRSRDEIRLSGLRCELINYHHLYKPHEIADLVYEVEHA